VNGVQRASPSALPTTASPTSYASWAQVVLAAVLMVATLPGRTQGLGLITEPILGDLTLDRVAYANMNLWATLLGALVCLPTGWAIDRFGLRGVTTVIVLALGFTVWRFSLLTANMVAIFGFLLATRAFGQSSLSVCSIATVARWFPNRAGFAMGVYSVLLSVFFAMAFGAIGYAVRVHGWRWAWTQMALVLLIGITPLVFFVLRKPPRESPVKPSQTESSGTLELTLFQALRTRAFWTFAGAAAAFNMVSSGLGLFNEAVLRERGFDQKTFHLFLVVSALTSLAGQLGCGWLSRRYRYQTLTFLALILYAAGLGLIPVIHQHWQLWGLAILLGGAGGMIIVVFFSVWSDFFGQRHLGRIQGAAQMITVFSSGLGPVLFAKCVALSGSYGPLLWTISVVVFLLSFVARAVPPPSLANADAR
jgi:MFS family permease